MSFKSSYSRCGLAYIPIFAGTLIIILCYLFDFNFADIGFTLFFSSCIFLYINYKNYSSNINIFEHLDLSKRNFLLINILFMLILFLIFINIYTYNNSIFYYSLTIILCLLVGFEVASTNYMNSYQVFIPLFKMLIVSALLRWNIYFQYPGYIGIDPWYHSAIISQIIQFGNLPLGYLYVKYPLTHLLISVGSIIINTNIKNSMIFTVGIFEILSLLYVFLIGRLVFSIRCGLLASLFVSVSSYHISWGYYIIPMSLGLGIFSLAFYLLCKKEFSNNLIITTLILFTSIFLVITHTISSTILLLFILVSYLTSTAYQKYNKDDHSKSFISLSMLLAICISTLGYWMYASGFFGYVVMSIKEAFTISEVEPLIANTMIISPLERELNRIELLLFLGFTLIGSLFLVSNNKLKQVSSILIVTSGFFTAIIFLSVFIGIDSILPDRWYAFLYVIAGNIISTGIYYLLSMFSRDRTKALALLFIIFIFTAVSITSSTANGGSAFYSSQKIQNALSEPEIISYESLLQFHSSGNFSSDSYSNKYFKYFANRPTYEISPELIDSFPSNDTLLALRVFHINSHLVQSSIKDKKDESGGYMSTYSRFHLNTTTLDKQQDSKIYDSFYVHGYISPST